MDETEKVIVPYLEVPHLEPKGRRDLGRRRAFPLEEKYSGCAHGLVEWLDVKDSARWQPSGSSTYCNVYAYDFLYQLNIPFPRVWWYRDQISEGSSLGLPVVYGKTVREMSANSLVDWMKEFGPLAGWEVSDDPEILEKNSEGYIGVILAKNKDRRRSGHVSIVFPKEGIPVELHAQSQAGRTNKNRFFSSWYNSSTFGEVLFCKYRLRCTKCGPVS